ncbi:hypothetical protein J6590_069452 [Homalodisca vitripennis]|nr:hypothetical protein J6590_069452 [Homalodisca vitripennis]
MPLGECSALPRTVGTGVARYEAFASHNVSRAVCLSVLEQCSKVPRSELCVKWIPALSASHRRRQNSALQTNKPPQRNLLLAQGSSNSGGKVPDDDPQYCHHSFGITPLVSLELRVPKKLVNNNCQLVVFTVYAIFSAVIFLLTRSFLLRFLNIH